MARRNNRAEGEPEPLSIVGEDLPRTRLETRNERDLRVREDDRKHRERTDARTDKRVAEAVDWNRCCVPGCNHEFGKAPRPLNSNKTFPPAPPRRARDVSEELPLCNRHLVIIQRQGKLIWADPDIVAEREKYARRTVRVNRERNAVFDKDHENNGHDGQLYFVKLNGLVKMGWSSKLRSRLKSYGADVEILCHFPGSRADETLLHRQLRPYLAKGREWYEDCPLIRDVIAGYIKQHGEPVIKPYWTEPKPPTIRARRAS